MADRSLVASALAVAPQSVLLAIARALPHRARLGFGSALMRGAVGLVPDLRARVEGNLKLIFPDMDAPERRRIRTAMANNFGRTLIEIMSTPAFQRRAPWSEPSGLGWTALQAARAEGRGAILVSGHFGQWEAGRGALKARGIECGALYRPLKNSYLEPIYRANLEAGGRPLCGRDGPGLRTLVRHLRGGGVIAVLLDQYVQGGVAIDFLGKPAPSGTMIAELALKQGVPMIPAYATREPDGVHLALDFEAPIPHTTALEMTQAAADSLARRVRAHPEQYYWLHRRWVKRF